MVGPEAHALFRAACEASDDFVLVTHMNPDGDALGSEYGLARFLLSRGKRVRLLNHDPTPDNLAFLTDPDVPLAVYRPEAHDDVLRGAGQIVLVDNSAPDRLGRMERAMLERADRVLCIDHHPSRESPWAGHILDERSCATAIMVYELTHACGWTPDRRGAEALYVGLATDTGFFRFNSTSVRAHEVAAELLRLGVEPARPYAQIYERNSVAFTRLLGHALVRLQVRSDGALVLVEIDRGLIARLDAEDVDTSEITTSLLAMDGVSVALLFRELPDSRIKVSLRSKGLIDVHRLASEFGGGGHRNASGIVLEAKLTDAVRDVSDRAAAMLVASGA